jgi:Zn-dependent peptidase ImmA (M78 family)
MHRRSTKNNNENEMSVLRVLRQLIPGRRLRVHEALRIAELQASHLLDLGGILDAPVVEHLVTTLPRIKVRYADLPTSGMSYWDGSDWIIGLNSTEPATRQRFTLMHEYKHIIDHGHHHLLYGGSTTRRAKERSEFAADHFAACVLMPRELVKRTWADGIRTAHETARHFEVSLRAAEKRLQHLGFLTEVNRFASTGPGTAESQSDTTSQQMPTGCAP